MKRKVTADEHEALEKRYLQVLAEKMDLERRCRALEEENRKESEQSREIRSIHENARRLKHDMKNHLMVTAAYLNAGENEQAKAYVSQILDKLSLSYSYIETGNAVLNFVINTKLELAQQKGMTIKAEIENLPFRRMESIDLSALLGNLLDNAVEAGSASAQKDLQVSVLRKRGYDTVMVKNSVDAPVLERNPTLKTTKEDGSGHGIGIRQIRSVVEKYDGLLDLYEESGMFCAMAMIPSE